ncbi:g4531 [Coccomyxa viridis]|uniref:G4531 protein n=1 Tax=Coccomyxa viridis TaxID=1274662 RepID=A0ABP1FT76_9CHLO
MVWPFTSPIKDEIPAVPPTSTKKICCACPETKQERDECVATYGPESERCAKLIEAHKQCLRAEGFKI